MRNLVSEFSAPVNSSLAAPDLAADVRITIDPMAAAPDDTPLVSSLKSLVRVQPVSFLPDAHITIEGMVAMPGKTPVVMLPSETFCSLLLCMRCAMALALQRFQARLSSRLAGACRHCGLDGSPYVA